MKNNELDLSKINIQNIINFDTADLAYKDAIECYRRYDLENNNQNKDYQSESVCAHYYSLNQYCIQRLTQALESYFKAISISNGRTWNDNRSLGHNLFSLYNEMIPNDLKYKIDLLFLQSDRYSEEVLDLKMFYFNNSSFDGPYNSIMLMFLEKKLKELSENRSLRKQNANVETRFPAEKYSEYDIVFLYYFSRIINIISYMYRNESSVLGVSIMEDNKSFVENELGKIFNKINIQFKDFDPNFIAFVQNRLDNVYSNDTIVR